MIADGDSQLNVQTVLNNESGLVHSAGPLEIVASEINNRHTGQSGKGLEAGKLTLAADILDNAEGAARSVSHLTARVTGYWIICGVCFPHRKRSLFRDRR